MPTRYHYDIVLPPELGERFERIAAEPGATKRSIIKAALEAFLERRGASEIDHRFALRLDRISKQLERIERNGNVELESLALFVRYMLTINAPLSEGDETARAIGRDRFSAFVNRVAQQLATGRRTFELEELL